MLSAKQRRLVERIYRGAGRRLFGEDVARADGRCRLAPAWLVLCVNNVCNLSCRMCDVGLGDTATVFWANLIGDHPQNMTIELLRTVLGQASEFPVLPRLGFAFTEPLIHPQIVEMVRLAKAGGFYVSVTSNGTTLARHAGPLVELGLDELNLSVDGPEEVHDAIRGGRQTFRRIAAGVEALNAAKAKRGSALPSLTVSFTVTDQNLTRVVDFAEAVAAWKADRINISQLNFITDEMASVHNAGHGVDLPVVKSNLGSMDPAAFDTAALAGELARLRERPGDTPLTFMPASTDEATLDTFYKSPLSFVGGRQCTDPWAMMMVKTDGAVIPAHGRCFNYDVGKVPEQSLPEIWNSDRFRTFRRTLRAGGGTLPACARCCGVIGKPVVERR